MKKYVCPILLLVAMIMICVTVIIGFIYSNKGRIVVEVPVILSTLEYTTEEPTTLITTTEKPTEIISTTEYTEQTTELVIVTETEAATTEILTTTEADIEQSVDEDELYMLSHLISAEAGSDWCLDEMRLYVGSVVLNRIKCKAFPNTMHDVIYQRGQYSCVSSGSYYGTPTKSSIETAKFLLENGSQLPENVVYQAGFEQGSGVHCIVQNMYFCYL